MKVGRTEDKMDKIIYSLSKRIFFDALYIDAIEEKKGYPGLILVKLKFNM